MYGLKSSGNASAKSNAMHHQPSINHKIRLQAELQIKPSLGKGALCIGEKQNYPYCMSAG